mgnify:CR=1 FL=1
MSVSLYLDCCALQRPFDDRSQLRVATEAEAVLKLIEFFEAGELVIISSGTLLFEVGQIQASERHTYCLNLLNAARTTSSLQTRFVSEPVAIAKKVSNRWMPCIWPPRQLVARRIFAAVMTGF